MGNILTGNPIFADQAGTLWDDATSTPKSLRFVQWVDDNGDLAHDSVLALTINGTALTVKIQPVNDQLGFGAVAWQIGPFNPGIVVTSFVISSMTTGNLHVWVT